MSIWRIYYAPSLSKKAYKNWLEMIFQKFISITIFVHSCNYNKTTLKVHHQTPCDMFKTFYVGPFLKCKWIEIYVKGKPIQLKIVWKTLSRVLFLQTIFKIVITDTYVALCLIFWRYYKFKLHVLYLLIWNLPDSILIIAMFATFSIHIKIFKNTIYSYVNGFS